MAAKIQYHDPEKYKNVERMVSLVSITPSDYLSQLFDDVAIPQKTPSMISLQIWESSVGKP